MKFCYEKISIEICFFLRGFLQNIGLTSLGPVSMLIYYNFSTSFLLFLVHKYSGTYMWSFCKKIIKKIYYNSVLPTTVLPILLLDNIFKYRKFFRTKNERKWKQFFELLKPFFYNYLQNFVVDEKVFFPKTKS